MVLLIILHVCVYMEEVIGHRRGERERERGGGARLGYNMYTWIKFVKPSVVMQNHCGTRLHCTRLPSSHRLRAFPPARA